MKKRPKKPIKVSRAKADDLPATRGMLKSVKNELREEIRATKTELTALVEREINGVKQIIHKTNQMVHQTNQMVHRSNVLFEEQNANNRMVLDGLQLLWERQERLEGTK